MMISIYKIIEKYSPTNDIFTDESEITSEIKKIIFNDLDEVDRRIILMYAELGSLRKLAMEIGVSATAIYYRVNEIREKILGKYDCTNGNTN